ncbi:MAG: PadR family transcriptional regulator [Acidobacteriaceae bacterium]
MQMPELFGFDPVVDKRYTRIPTMGKRDKLSNPLNPATLHILLALVAQDLHGYGIMLEVERQSQGRYKLGPGTLYDNLKKLMDKGFIVDAPRKTIDDETRRLYRLTGDGRALLKAEVLRLEQVVSDARSYLGERKPRKA